MVASVKELKERLATVLDPELGASITELGMVGDVALDGDGRARIDVALTTGGCPLRTQIERDVREAALALDVAESLASMGHPITVAQPFDARLGHCHAIELVDEGPAGGGTLAAATDPRSAGLPAVW